MSIQDYQNSAKNRVASWRLGRKFLWICLIVLACFAIYAAFIIYFPYSDGTRTGVLRKLSHKGYVFKTWEGELQMPGATMLGDGSQLTTSATWTFSVDRNRPEVIEKLKEAESKGKPVTVHYVQHIKQMDWRGETVYFVDNVNIVQ